MEQVLQVPPVSGKEGGTAPGSYQVAPSALIPVALGFLKSSLELLRPNLWHSTSAVQQAAAEALAVLLPALLHAPRSDFAAAAGFRDLETAAAALSEEVVTAVEGTGKLV